MGQACHTLPCRKQTYETEDTSIIDRVDLQGDDIKGERTKMPLRDMSPLIIMTLLLQMKFALLCSSLPLLIFIIWKTA